MPAVCSLLTGLPRKQASARLGVKCGCTDRPAPGPVPATPAATKNEADRRLQCRKWIPCGTIAIMDVEAPGSSPAFRWGSGLAVTGVTCVAVSSSLGLRRLGSS